jgi:hypothetical protein
VTVIEQHRADLDNPYGLRLERLVHTHAELGAAKRSVSDLDRLLRRTWPYIAGAPMNIQQAHMTISVDGPFGWRTNYREVYEQVPGARLNLSVGRVERDFGITLSTMPLKSVLEAMPAFRSADEMAATLVDLHLDTWAHYQHSVEIFLFAKTLELAVALLPGQRMAEKQAALPRPFGAQMTKDLDWLKMVMNTRIDARHSVTNRSIPELHPRMTPQERLAFINNADLAIRAVISLRLGVELNSIERPR